MREGLAGLLFTLIIAAALVWFVNLKNAENEPKEAAATPFTELVMHQGTAIHVVKDGASLTITAGKGFARTYEWGGCALQSHMWARRKRWYGRLDIYDAAPSSGYASNGCNGIYRTVVEEGQMHFDNLAFAREWIRRQQMAYANGITAWTSDGLLISWNTTPGRAQLSVDVYLMCIKGKRLRGLKGATDSAVKVVANAQGQTLYDCTTVSEDEIKKGKNQMQADWRMVDASIALSHKADFSR